MKGIKRTIAIIMSIIMLLSINISYCPSIKEVSAYTGFTITSPKSGSLHAAGDIDITWTDASSMGTVKDYKLYFDGKLVTTTTKTSYEIHTTKVNYHNVFVKATFTNGGYASTQTVRFGITKKGLGLATDMGRSISLKNMGVAWYYNWGTAPSSGQQYQGIEYVPMVWTSNSANDIYNKVNMFKEQGYKYVLTFNEPDLQNQCNMSVNSVYNVWQGLDNVTGIKISSPVTAIWPSASTRWFQAFMKKIDTNNDHDVDFISIHCYPDNWDGGKDMADWFLREVVDKTWNMYHKPIWVTEFSTDDNNQAITEVGTRSFVENVLPGLDSRDYVERYAFFSFNRSTTNAGLWHYGSGALSSSGRAYARLGNPTSDYIAGNEKNPGTKLNTPNNKPKPVVKKPAKAVIRTAKNIKKRKIRLSLKKINTAKGYQIRWADNRRFFGYWQKTITKRVLTIKYLDKKTRYFIKARAYTMNGKKKLYGAWSNKKSVYIRK